MPSEQVHQISRQFRWEAAHRLAIGYEGKCAQIHGHSWRAMVQVTLRPGASLSESGFIMDFAEFKKVQAWIDQHLDHSTIVDDRDEALLRFLREDHQKHYALAGRSPSSEHLCQELMRVSIELLENDRCCVTEVRVSETCSNEARLTRSPALR